MVLQNYQNLIEMTSNIIYIVAYGVGFKCPRKIHLKTQCPPPLLATALFWSTQVHSHNGKRYYPLTNPFLNQIVRIWCVQNCVRLILLDLNQNIIMFCFFLHLLNNFMSKLQFQNWSFLLDSRFYSCDHLCMYNKCHATWSK